MNSKSVYSEADCIVWTRL